MNSGAPADSVRHKSARYSDFPLAPQTLGRARWGSSERLGRSTTRRSGATWSCRPGTRGSGSSRRLNLPESRQSDLELRAVANAGEQVRLLRRSNPLARLLSSEVVNIWCPCSGSGTSSVTRAQVLRCPRSLTDAVVRSFVFGRASKPRHAENGSKGPARESRHPCPHVAARESRNEQAGQQGADQQLHDREEARSKVWAPQRWQATAHLPAPTLMFPAHRPVTVRLLQVSIRVTSALRRHRCMSSSRPSQSVLLPNVPEQPRQPRPDESDCVTEVEPEPVGRQQLCVSSGVG